MRKFGQALLLLMVTLATTFTLSSQAIGDPVCVPEVREDGRIVVVCDDDGAGGPGDAQDPGGPGNDSPTCKTFDGAEVPCVTELGVWVGDCYAAPADPQPPFEDPIWEGRTDGVILRCVRITEGSYFTMRTYWAPSAEVVTVDPVDLARRAVASMQLTTPALEMTPPPNLEDPNVLINLPAHLWFSHTDARALGPVTASASDAGLTVTATAELARLELDTGDGHVITCRVADVLGPPADVMQPPTCGHIWTEPSTSHPGGVYVLTLTSYWEIPWTGGGQSGSLTTTTSATLAVAVTDHPVRLVPTA